MVGLQGLVPTKVGNPSLRTTMRGEPDVTFVTRMSQPKTSAGIVTRKNSQRSNCTFERVFVWASPLIGSENNSRVYNVKAPSAFDGL